MHEQLLDILATLDPTNDEVCNAIVKVLKAQISELVELHHISYSEAKELVLDKYAERLI